jgi:EAL domain-containing protein (putative c-di-GMP-specific phosphodiesterase class I)
VEGNEFVLFYQPKIDVQTNTIIGVEALLRWHCPENGIITPDKFIPLAEETGLIVPIGVWVLNTACKQSVAWQKAGKGPIDMAVNLSPLQFQDKDLLPMVAHIIKRSQVNPQLLTLELTESMLLEDVEKKIGLMQRLKKIGVKLAIDDFGTGYSSLSYLRKLPLDELKIDRSFLIDLTENSSSRAIVSSMVFLARNLDMVTVAEGVETTDQLRILREEGCDYYQGFLFSRPVPSTKLFQLLNSSSHHSAQMTSKD